MNLRVTLHSSMDEISEPEWAELESRKDFFLSHPFLSAAICYRTETTLYGRHWGADDDYHSLHFELCYYQGIEYCIRNGLARFEPGAHGEHKVSRGFSPMATWSAHWIADPRMRRAIEDYLKRERSHMESYQDEMAGHEPYKAILGTSALPSDGRLR